jgi:VanZ family protein
LNQVRKYITSLLTIYVLLGLTGFLVIKLAETGLNYSDLLFLLTGFSLISAITILIFLRGQTKDPESQTMHTLVSIGLKFLLDLVMALACFVISKKSGVPYVLLFFVLYLCLTLFSVFYMLKTLKSKPL